MNPYEVEEFVVIGESTKRFSSSIPLANLTGVNNFDFIKNTPLSNVNNIQLEPIYK